MSDSTITYEQARLRLHDHLGDNVYAGLQVRGESGMSEVFSLHGRLSHPLGERPGESIQAGTRDIFGSAYVIAPNADSAARVAPSSSRSRRRNAGSNGSRAQVAVDRKSTRLNSSHLGISYA